MMRTSTSWPLLTHLCRSVVITLSSPNLGFLPREAPAPREPQNHLRRLAPSRFHGYSSESMPGTAFWHENLCNLLHRATRGDPKAP